MNSLRTLLVICLFLVLGTSSTVAQDTTDTAPNPGWVVSAEVSTATSLTSPYSETFGTSIKFARPIPSSPKWSISVGLGSAYVVPGGVGVSFGVTLSREIGRIRP